MTTLGVISAGGRSVRYGSPKALATVGSVPIIARVRNALAPVTPNIIVIANDPAPYARFGFDVRPDARADVGALGGIYTALQLCEQMSADCALVVACDMPFLSTDLLHELVRTGEDTAADVVVPESGSRRGVEPLCALYRVSCLPAIEARIEREDLRVVGFYDDVRVVRLPLERVGVHGEPEIMFLNVNTPEERERAEQLASELRV